MATPISPGPSRVRLTVLLIVVGCLFAALIARLWFLQVVNVATATTQITQAAYATVYIPAPRGEILDRNGNVLVGNKQVPVIEVQQQEGSNAALVARLAALVGTTPAAMKAAIDNPQFPPYAPVPVYTQATAAQILYVDEHRNLFPGVSATTESVPYATTLGVYAGDVVGYVGQVDSAELASLQKAYPNAHYQPGDIVGQSGIEAEYQQYLNGTPGVERIQVNPLGQEIRVVSYTPPVPGDNVVLTINGKLQEVADQSILQGEAVARTQIDPNGTGYYKAPGGAAVVEDPRNGQVLALATEPTFNPNWFNEGITEAQYESLVRNPADPFDNRAIAMAVAPGSTFKLVTATAQLHYGIRSATAIFNDTRGFIDVGGQIFHDDGGVGAGYIDLPQALTVSSDNYFNTIGEDLWNLRGEYGPIALQKVAYSYGLGSPTGIDLPGEVGGLIPTPAVIQKEYSQHLQTYPIWFTGYSIEMAIGQFQDEVTPIQLANAYSTFANGGTRYRPELVLRIVSPSGKVIRTAKPDVEGHSASLSAADRQAIIQGYLGVTHNPAGTGYPVFANTSLAGEDIAGKTGTAQVQGGQDTSVFMGFAPATNTRYVVDSFVQDAGYGESISAPIVRRIYDEIFHKKLDPISFQPVTGSPG
jgi:penicillin-binding protein 2